MIEWIVFAALVAGYVAATIYFVPLRHRLAYKLCRGRMFWLGNLLPHLIWITAAAQSLISPKDCPLIIHIAGAVVFTTGAVLIVSARRVNVLFVAPIIYVPPHMRVSNWPYSWQTHPGYNGMYCMATGAAFLLGQPWAFFPYIAYVILITWRMIVENRILSQPPSL